MLLCRLHDKGPEKNWKGYNLDLPVECDGTFSIVRLKGMIASDTKFSAHNHNDLRYITKVKPMQNIPRLFVVVRLSKDYACI